MCGFSTSIVGQKWYRTLEPRDHELVNRAYG